MKKMKFYVLLIGLFAAQLSFAKSALIIVDMQNCFINGEDKSVHSLPVNGGKSLIKTINEIQEKVKFDMVVATKDWHTADHISFASQHEGKKPYDVVTLPGNIKQTLWPDHCVQNTLGAEFVAGLETKNINKIIYKGDHQSIDSYSGFFDNGKQSQTELDSYLKENKVTELYVVGLAADFCVKFTSLDGAMLKYNTHFVKDLTKAVFPDKLEESTYSELRKAGVKIISSNEIK